ncbi:MAG: PH domain-containing protein [Phycisphaerae bacterium]|nr:PH domain-containing protein [Phycisphaerae bacterium]
MISVVCDRCEKPFEVEDSKAGTKVPCPACGDVNVVRPSAGVDIRAADKPLSDHAAKMGLPPAFGPEVSIMTVRAAMFRAHPLRFLVLVAFVLGGGAGVFLLPGIGSSGTVLAFAAGALCVLGLGWLGYWRVETLGAGLEITTKRSVATRGLLSRMSTEVMHEDIRNLQISQSLLNRIMQVGTLAISSSAQNEMEIVARDIPGPYNVRRVIDAYRSSEKGE